MGTLYIVLHCQSCYNKNGIFTGRANVDLTDTGHTHAKIIADKLKNIKIDIAYSSPLKRTLQTLEPILKYHTETKTIIDDRIIERDYGDLTHKIKDDYKKKHPKLFEIYHRSFDVPPPNGESIKDVEERVIPFLYEIVSKIKNNQTILIVTHSNAVRPMRRFLENLSIKETMKLKNDRDKIYKYIID